MPSVRGTQKNGSNNNVIQGDGVAQFSGSRWVEVHALHVVKATDMAANDPLEPTVDVEYANGQVTMSKGPVPKLGWDDTVGAGTIAIIGFSEATRIFEGWVAGTPEAEQVLKISDPGDNNYIFWEFSHRAQP